MIYARLKHLLFDEAFSSTLKEEIKQMKKTCKNPKVICSVVCAVIMLAILVMMFVPYWNYTGTNEETFAPEERTVSINGYLWFPSDHSELEDVFNADSDNDIDANTLALPIGMQILFAGFGIALCLWKPKVTAVGALPIACGIFGIYGYAFVSALRMTSPALWIINLALAVASLVAGIIFIVFGFKYKETIESLRKA